MPSDICADVGEGGRREGELVVRLTTVVVSCVSVERTSLGVGVLTAFAADEEVLVLVLFRMISYCT
jgi:hypothetical protein